MMRVVECNTCGGTLAGADDEERLRRLRQHTEAVHSSAGFDESQASEAIANEAYDASDS